MNNATLYNKRQFTAEQANAIGAAIKDKWDQLKAWPDYRGHDEPSLYPKYLHVSALCGMRPVVDKGGVPLLSAVGDEVMEPWVNKGITYKKQKNESADTA
jgi:hypothetical protein